MLSNLLSNVSLLYKFKIKKIITMKIVISNLILSAFILAIVQLAIKAENDYDDQVCEIFKQF